MTHIVGILFIWLLAVQGNSAALFEVGLWPGEGRPVLAAASSRLLLYERASTTSAPAVRLSVSPGQRLAFDDTKYITSKPGRLRALRSATVVGRLLGTTIRLSSNDYYSGTFSAGSVSVGAGSELDYLQYRAEGTCFVRVNGETIDADPCPALGNTSFRLEAEPEVEWWVHIVPSAGRAGWAQVTETTIKVIDREF